MLDGAPLNAVLLLLKDGGPDTLPARERYQRFRGLADDKYICAACSKDSPCSILNVHNVIRTRMTLTMFYDSNSPDVVTTSDHGQIANIKFDVIGQLSSCKVNLHGVIDFDGRIGIPESTTIVGDKERNALSSDLHTSDSPQFVLGFFVGDAVDGETTLGIIQQAEVFRGLVNGNNVHVARRVVGISPYFVVDFHEPLHQDEGHLPLGQGILEAITQKNDQGQTFTRFVGTSGGLGGKYTAHFVQHPMFGGI